MPQLKYGFIPSIVPYRKFASRVFLPEQNALAEMGDKMPFAFAAFDSNDIGLPNGVASQDVAYGDVTQPEDCWITHFLASSWLTLGGTQPAGVTVGAFAVQFYDANRQKLWSESPIQFANALGSGLQFTPESATHGFPFPNPVPAYGALPLYLKRPYKLPAGGALQTRVINLSSDTNQIQIAAWGLRQ